jgi:hypothetical protein
MLWGSGPEFDNDQYSMYSSANDWPLVNMIWQDLTCASECYDLPRLAADDFPTDTMPAVTLSGTDMTESSCWPLMLARSRSAEDATGAEGRRKLRSQRKSGSSNGAINLSGRSTRKGESGRDRKAMLRRDRGFWPFCRCQQYEDYDSGYESALHASVAWMRGCGWGRMKR